MAKTNVGMMMPPQGPLIKLEIAKDDSTYYEGFWLSPDQARETARGLILMADLYEDLKKRDPKTGKFR